MVRAAVMTRPIIAVGVYDWRIVASGTFTSEMPTNMMKSRTSTLKPNRVRAVTRKAAPNVIIPIVIVRPRPISRPTWGAISAPTIPPRPKAMNMIPI